MLDGIQIKRVETPKQEKIIDSMMDKLCDILEAGQTPQLIVVALQLPSGAVEVIQNAQQIPSKVKYYYDSYTSEGQHKNGAGIQILDYMLI